MRKDRHATAAIFLCGAFYTALSPSTVSPAALTWVGTGADNDFNTSGNWNPAQTPTASDSCTVNSTSNRQPSILTNSTCGSLTLGTGATLMTLTFSGVQNLNVTGDVTIGISGRIAPSGTPAGVFTIGGNWSDDLATNFQNAANLQLQYDFTGAGKTISTNESFYKVQISGTLTLSSDLTIDGNLVVAAGATFTIQTDRNIQVNDFTTINGSVYLSGTSTWSQRQASSQGIRVAVGGLLSAQGASTTNRVTFTRLGAAQYDLIINGGIDFNYVNIHYTRSATDLNGFAINSPAGATVNFNRVAFNFTENVNKAVMMVWNSNRTITATGCTFDSQNYNAANEDANVEARLGTINFTSYDGNYAGEVLDFDNGGNANWITSVTKRAFTTTGTAIPDASTVFVGTPIKFMLYINHTGSSAMTDVTIHDVLPANFAYQSGTIKVVNPAGDCAPPATTCTAAEESSMFGTADAAVALTDAVDGDTASFAGSTVDVGNQFVANAQQNVASSSRFVVLFTVLVQ